MQKLTKNTIIDYLPKNIDKEDRVLPARIFDFNNFNPQRSYVAYLCEREIRLKDNLGLNFAIEKAKELNTDLKIIHPRILYEHKPKQEFIDKQISETKKNFENAGLGFMIYKDSNLVDYLNSIKISHLIIDFNPILDRTYLENTNFKIYEVDGHNIIPARYLSDKQEYSAATIRRKIYHNIYPFFKEPKNTFNCKTEADGVLSEFIKYKLPFYAEFKNNPTKDIISNLSKYLNLGFISPIRVALEVIKSNVTNENKESFLEELIVRKELADNFCLYVKNFKTFDGIPSWAKQSLKIHSGDIRNYIYTKEELENAKTHDKLWNASQIQLVKEGKIHGYLRMYWAKKILEWTLNPQIALKTAIYLNDKYGYDSPSPNGYVGILWAIGGLHDRAFQDWEVTGKIRRMSYDSTKRKFKIQDYIDKYLC